MKRKTKSLISGLLTLILIFFNGILATNGALNTHNIEWKVSSGDAITYIYKNFYDITRTNPYEFSVSGIDVNGELVSVTVEKGTKITYTITSKPTTGPIFGTMTFDSNITLEEQPISDIIIIKTVNNRSYWENYYKNDQSFSIQGDLLIQASRTYDVYFDGGQAYPYELTTSYKWNWKTGWLTSFYIRSRSYETNETYYEEIFEAESTEKSINNQLQSNTIFGSILLSLILIILVVEKKFIEKDK
ncbi:MAG: hypothetical protein ACFFB5_06255 [Promethearchaeota archaeon]